jgi:hypothetical protein
MSYTFLQDTLLLEPPCPEFSKPAHGFQTYAHRKQTREKKHKSQVVDNHLPTDVQRYHTRTAIRKTLHNPNTRSVGKVFPHLKATPGPSRLSLSMKPLGALNMDMIGGDAWKRVHGLLKIEQVDKSLNIPVSSNTSEETTRMPLKQSQRSKTSYSKFLLSQREGPVISPLSSKTAIMRPTPPTSAKQRRPRIVSNSHDWSDHALAESLLSNLDLDPVKDIPFKQSSENNEVAIDEDDISAYSVPIASPYAGNTGRSMHFSAGDPMFTGSICAWEEECT